MTMSELKPCPFCGQEVTLISTSTTKSFVISHVGLRNCAFYKFEMPWEVGESLKNATTLWNRRAFGEWLLCASDGNYYAFRSINYCPFCGRKLTEE
jgi:endogenous inhibitor of DNA gyrase (YacG/DUF329 family)